MMSNGNIVQNISFRPNNEVVETSKPFVIIVGLGYRGTEQALPGVVIDMFRMHEYAVNVINADVIVLTDIVSDESPQYLSRAILNGVDKNVLTFISLIARLRKMIPWTPLPRASPITDIDSLVRPLQDVILACHQRERVLFYFTGHGQDGSITTPDNAYVPMVAILNEISNKMKPGGELMWIADCCQASTLELPFIWTQSTSVFRDEIKLGYFKKQEVTKNIILPIRVVAIMSSSGSTNSNTSIQGSNFTYQIVIKFQNAYEFDSIYLHLSENGSAVLVSNDELLRAPFSWITKCNVTIDPMGGLIVHRN